MSPEENVMYNMENLAQNNAQKIVRMFLVCNNPAFIRTLRYFDEGVTNSMKVFCCERTSTRRTGERRNPFTSKILTQKLRCSLPAEHSRVLCEYKQKQTRNQACTWALNMDDDGRAVFTSLIMHMFNYCAAVIAENEENGTGQPGRASFVAVLNGMSYVEIVQDGEPEFRFRYTPPTTEEETLNAVYVKIQEKVAGLGSEIVNELVEKAVESRWSVVKPPCGGVRRVLNAGRHITGREIIEPLIGDATHVGRIYILFCENIFSVSVLYGLISRQQLYVNNHTVAMRDATRRLFTNMMANYIVCLQPLDAQESL